MIIPALIFIKKLSCNAIVDLSEIANELNTIFNFVHEFSLIISDSLRLFDDPNFLGESDNDYNDTELSD